MPRCPSRSDRFGVRAPAGLLFYLRLVRVRTCGKASGMRASLGRLSCRLLRVLRGLRAYRPQHCNSKRMVSLVCWGRAHRSV